MARLQKRWNKADYYSALEELLLTFHLQQPVGKILTKWLGSTGEKHVQSNIFLIWNNVTLSWLRLRENTCLLLKVLKLQMWRFIAYLRICIIASSFSWFRNDGSPGYSEACSFRGLLAPLHMNKAKKVNKKKKNFAVK